MEAAAREAHRAALDCEGRARPLEEAQGAMEAVAEQREQLQLELALLADRQQEAEAREAALGFREAAWGCLVRQATCGAGGAGAEVLEAVRDGVCERVVEELLHADPCLRRDRNVVWEAKYYNNNKVLIIITI